jgi:hypothetical protein
MLLKRNLAFFNSASDLYANAFSVFSKETTGSIILLPDCFMLKARSKPKAQSPKPKTNLRLKNL